MEPQLTNETFELISNPILRLLVGFLATAVAGMAGALVFMYRERQGLTQQLIDLNRETSATYALIDQALDRVEARFDEMHREFISKLLNHEKNA